MRPYGFDLGKRLRAVREQYGLSQRELARRTGITNGSISMIEKNVTSPSVASLKRLLDAIPMSLAEFFSLDEPASDQIFFSQDELVALTDGDIRFCSIGDNAGVRQLQILYERYAPGADTGEAMLQHEAEEGGYVISGCIEITVGDQARSLSAGEAYYFDSRQPHRFRNRSNEECIIVSACTPPYL